jgi:non-specific serine/threonine protein kinase
LTPTLLEILDEKNIREYAGYQIFKRGLAYYREGRVEVTSVTEEEALCHVRGTRFYYVNLWKQHNELFATCTCPYAQSGWFCKHMVAAGLAVRAYLLRFNHASWKVFLSNTIDEVSKSSPRKPLKSYWLFFSLQVADRGWQIFPYRLWTEQVPKGIFPPTHEIQIDDSLAELVSYNQWLLKYIKNIRTVVNLDEAINLSPDAVAFSNILINQDKTRRDHYSYFQPYPLGDYLSLLSQLNIPLFFGNVNNPVRTYLRILPDPGEIILQIKQAEDGILLSVNLIADGQVIQLARNRVQILTHEKPYWTLVGDSVLEINSPFTLDRFASFMRAPDIVIPAEQENDFLENYFPILASHFPISGDRIRWVDEDSEPMKRIYLIDEGNELQAHLRFGYGDSEVSYEPDYPNPSIRRMDDSWTLVRIHRKSDQEEDAYRSLSSAYHGLKRAGKDDLPNVFSLRARVDPIDFLMRHVPRLTEAGFEIFGEDKLKTVRVNRHTPTLSLNISSGIDWFDIQAVIHFGDVEASLKEVRTALQRKELYIKLADGTIGEIPEEWIQRYKHLFGLGEQTDRGIRLSHHHLSVIDQLLAGNDQYQVDKEYHRKRKRLLDFDGIQIQKLPKGFVGELRPYQKSGYDWLHFLHEYEFGGCLADDMGLGKTIETLALLQSLKESGHAESASLLVLPRSLLVNWQREAARFTPDLKVYSHFGKERSTNVEFFNSHDLVITTYGTMLRDIKFLAKYRFHYVILDESQAIKNPLAKTSKAARLLKGDHRLVLTGTPVENSTFELWSQFAFLNPGLLGNLAYFKREFGNPIERKGDSQASDTLRKMVYPFILRRTKEQVAPELPPRTERVIYCDMEPAQRNFYKKTRDYYRAMLMGIIGDQGMDKARMKILEGLLRLRQISNHPKLVKEGFRGDSSKFLLLIETLETLQAEGHKGLVFSQFVQMLKLVRNEMETRKIPYAYLDGRTRKRQERIDAFQNNLDIPFFLISLKAGGVGLNLTAADYVIHIDPWWNPAVEMQATDRTHRIGQDKPVFVYKLITRDSVEEKILLLQEKKRNLVEQLITTEENFFKDLSIEDVDILFS